MGEVIKALSVVTDHRTACTPRGPHVSARSLGYPNVESVESGLFSFLNTPHNIRYLYNLCVPSDDANHEDLTAVVRRVFIRLQASLGGFEDSFLGVNNLFLNLEDIVCSPDLYELSVGVSKSCPALVVGAGPSVDFDFLRRVYERGDICMIVVDAIYPTLLSRGIEPHLVVTTERIEETAWFFRGQRESRSILVGCFVSDREVVESFCGLRVFMYRNHGPSHFFPWVGRRVAMSATSVGPTALAVAGVLGFRSVAVQGLDFCYDSRSFASHAEMVVDRFRQWSEPSSEFIRVSQEGAFRSGDGCLTNPVWTSFMHHCLRVIHHYGMNVCNVGLEGRSRDYLVFRDSEEWLRSFSSSSGGVVEFDRGVFDLRPCVGEMEAIELEVCRARDVLERVDLSSMDVEDLVNFYPMDTLARSALLYAIVYIQGMVFRHSGEVSPSILGEFYRRCEEAKSLLLSAMYRFLSR